MTGWSRLVASQLARAVAAVIAVAVLATLLGEVAPGSATERAARAAGVMPPPDAPIPEALRAELLGEIERRHRLDRGWLARVGDAARLELGSSWVDRRSVGAILADRLPRTGVLVALAFMLAVVGGVGVALTGARRPGRPADVALAGVAAVAVAVPPVWLAILLLRWLAAGEPLSILPVEGSMSPAGLLLPVISLAVVPTFVIGRHLRAALVEARARGWAVAARARGASERRVLIVHALRVELPTLLPLAVGLIAYLFGAAVVIEELFGVPGIGRTLVDAAGRGDQPVVVGVCVAIAGAIALTSAAVELARAWLDPRGGDA